MKSSFKKTLVAAGMLATGLAAFDSSAVVLQAPTAGDKVIIGCTVPTAGTAGATVYSIDAVTSQGANGATISLPTTVAFGASCTGAINSLTTNISGSQVKWQLDAAVPTNFVLPSTGYSLQKFSLTYLTTAVNGSALALVSCSAAVSGGAASVYSVDFGGVANTGAAGSNTNIANSLLGVLPGYACSQGLTSAQAALGITLGAATPAQNAPAFSVNLGSTYALTQYVVQ